MSLESEVHDDLVSNNGDKTKLMQQWSNELKKILDSYGGNISDIPIIPSKPNSYYRLQAKILLLNKI